MPFILDISTVVPEYKVSKNDFVKFYSRSIGMPDNDMVFKKLNYVISKTNIQNRFSCISDFNGETSELFEEGNYNPTVEKRMVVYKDKVVKLSVKAISQLLNKTKVKATNITHLITVSCTGVYAPGLELDIASELDLQHAEKTGLYFMGCHAALKALKQAHYIAKSEPRACVLIVCVELSSLHFTPSMKDDDLLANLIFSDGAAAVIVCGNENELIRNRKLLSIDSFKSACVPNTSELMTWNISANAFRMILSKHIANVIRDNLFTVVNDFNDLLIEPIDHYAIHPGGVRIVDAVKDSLSLTDSQVYDSLNVLQRFGNMSSPTILFILKTILDRIQSGNSKQGDSVFACAFGPGITVEMMMLSMIETSFVSIGKIKSKKHAVQV